MKEVLLTINLINYPRKILLTKKRRAKYFHPGDILPKKYLSNQIVLDNNPLYALNNIGQKLHLNNRYSWEEHKLSGKRKEIRLYNSTTAEYVIKNSRVAGTENWKQIAGQDIYRFGMQNFYVSRIIGELHKYYMNYLTIEGKGQISFKDSVYPIKIHYHFECEMDYNMDVDNYALPYYKAFQDCLVKSKIIPNDTRKYVDGFKITSEHRKGDTDRLIIKIYANSISKDTNKSTGESR